MKLLNVYIKELLSEQIELDQSQMPALLYHATYEHLLPSIQSDGLGGDRDTQWDDSARGVVYLAKDPYIAESYAETADAYEENEDYEIVILEIDTSHLDQSMFQIDRNVIDNEGDTVEYHGVIPVQALKVWGS